MPDLTAYEDDVLALLDRHGARLVARVHTTTGPVGQPTEVQIIDLRARPRSRRTSTIRTGSP
ncbi:hypothetical protein [Amycolatopsis taiwanensis]|uniref:hypothetical protein n=1 Tax=Amycolatopsis taiwanensis TaxID=342230 RepID=UPI002555F7AF|nr:hypothetical protein [Amycolatopsis taiwanensis]